MVSKLHLQICYDMLKNELKELSKSSDEDCKFYPSLSLLEFVTDDQRENVLYVEYITWIACTVIIYLSIYFVCFM